MGELLGFVYAVSPRAFRGQFGKILLHRYGTLIKLHSGVFESLKQRLSSLSYDQRIHNILPVRSRYTYCIPSHNSVSVLLYQ